jgi:hypothetical protein
MRNRCCAVVAYGTRGDVQPLALLAWQLQHEIAKSDKNAAVTCITHHQHQVRNILQMPGTMASTL